MALVLPAKTPHGLTVNGAYHRITFVRILPPGDFLVQVSIYADEKARRENKQPLDAPSWQVVPVAAQAGETIVGSLYRTLKTLAEFANAVDVFDTAVEQVPVPPVPEASPAPSPAP